MKHIFFNTPTKGKVIIAFITACTALVLAWNVSKLTFREMLQTVELISAPNDKLTIVNHLSGRINNLDRLQRTMTVDRETYHNTFFKEFGKLRLTLDTLGSLYKDNPLQIKRINSMKQLLIERNRLFLNYLNIREELVNNKVLTDQIQSLNGKLLSRLEQTDSTTIQTTEKKVSTTTLLPAESEESKGFFGRLFSGKKDRKTDHRKVVNEELNITVDTIVATDNDRTLNEVKQAMLSMKKNQLQQTEKFVNRETQLALATNNITSQMLDILQQVEEDVMKQSEENNAQARAVVNESVKYINIILVSFLLLTAILLYFILTDISRSNAYRKQLEDAKEEAEYHAIAKQRFLSNMSHEIRTPLQAIIGYTELMKKGNTEKYTIDAINHSSTHLMHIVNEILDYSRIISDKFSINISEFNLIELLNEVVSVMRLSAEEKSLTLLTNFDLSPSEVVKGDSFRLKQILYNLLSNAVKFTNEGTITLNASCKNHNGSAHVMLSVEDTGVGISDADLKRIFNEFEQAQSFDREKIASGSGLGLSIVKAITESQGGRIHAKSELGKGSCFTLFMRFELVEKQEIKLSKYLSQVQFKGKIWVIDDDSFILHLCSAILGSNAIQHTCFNDPKKVLETQWDNSVTCILMDMRMPGMNGSELCSILRNRIPSNVKIYALTAQVLPDERANALLQGFDGILMKPFKESELLDLIHEETIPPPAESSINFDTLKQMTFGDETQMRKILERFIYDSEHDIHQLNAAIDNSQRDEVSLLLHRIAGRTAQIGAKQIASDFRMLELDSQNEMEDENQIVKIKESINNLSKLVLHIEKEMEEDVVS